MNRINVSNCKACGAPIVWMKTRNNKNIPVDRHTVRDLEAEVFDPATMIAHFASCPKAADFRKKR